MTIASEILSKWNQRNAAQLRSEIDTLRRSRIWCVTVHELQQRVLTEAALRSASALQIQPKALVPTFRRDPTSGELQLGVQATEGTEIEPTLLGKVFAYAFKQVSEEWGAELGHAVHDDRYYAALLPTLPKITLEEWKQVCAARSSAQ